MEASSFGSACAPFAALLALPALLADFVASVAGVELVVMRRAA
jgi:hypothetical protein